MASGGGKRPRPSRTPTSPVSPEVSGLIPVIQQMNDEQTMKLQQKFGTSFAELERNIMNEVKQIREQFAEIVNTVEYNSKDIADLKKEMKKMKEEMNTTEKEYKEELDRVETYAARENLVFLNIPEKIQKEGERENVEKVMKEFMITNYNLRKRKLIRLSISEFIVFGVGRHHCQSQ